MFVIFAGLIELNGRHTMIKLILILLVLLIDYLGYRYGRAQLFLQHSVGTTKGKSIQNTWSKKKAQFEEKAKQLEREIKEEEDDFDDLIDKDTFNFLLAGAIATLLFLLVGLFTGNPLYFYLIIFLITTLVYVYYSKLQ